MDSLTFTLAPPLAMTFDLQPRPDLRPRPAQATGSYAYVVYTDLLFRGVQAISPLHPRYISSISPLYLPYISPTDLLFRGAQAELFTLLVSALSVLGAPPAA